MVAAWFLGVLIGLETDAPLAALLFLSGAAVTSGLAMRLRMLPVFPAVLALLLLLGVWRGDTVASPPSPFENLSLAGQTGAEVTLEGQISGYPELSGSRVRFPLDLKEVFTDSGAASLEGRILVYARPSDDLVGRRSPPYFNYGDQVTVTGNLSLPEPFGGFDYPAYLAGQGITGIMNAGSTIVTGETGGWRHWPYSLRSRLSDSIQDTVPYPQSALGQALLLGLKSDLPPEMVQDFRSTGTSHLLAISGLHVGVLVVMFLAGSSWLLGRRGWYFLAVPLIAVWTYALVTGLPPSVVRAAMMGSVYLVAIGLGRPGSILPALAFSAGVMTAVSPEIIQRVSFQLSFAAMAGIAFTQPFIPRWAPAPSGPGHTWWEPWAYSLVRAPLIALIISWFAMLATWPLLAFNFREVALPGIIVTVLALPAMPFIMAGTLLAAVVGLASTTLGQIFGWMVWVPSSYLIELVELAPKWTVQTDWANNWLVVAWYSALGVLLLSLKPGRLGWAWSRVKDGTRALADIRMEPVKTVPVLLGAAMMTAAAVALWWQVGSGGDGDLHVYFFDVGQGDSALIVTPGGRQVLVDGGPKSDSAIRALDGAMPSGDRSLDLVVMTHLDSDHSRGLLDVLDSYQVGAVLSGAANTQSAMYAQWQASLVRNRVDVISVHQGYRLDLGSGVMAEVLNPLPATSDQTANNGALVLRVTYGDISFLLTADVEAATESILAAGHAGIQSTVLKVAHHGSKTSSTASFLDAVDPAVALISVGETNSFGHPSPEVIGRLLLQTKRENLYRTDQDGEVEFITDGQDLWVNTER
jgi:competence protein ComEC